MIPGWLQAGLWGLLAGSALLLGAAIGYWVRLSPRIIASVMAFGSGVLISALTFELMESAYAQGGFSATALGFVGGAAVYTGAKHRKRSNDQQPSHAEDSGSGASIALGALIDGVPESIVIGIGLLGGGAVSIVTVAAIFLSNIPEALSSSAGMKRAGRSQRYIFGVWGGIALVSGVAAVVGYSLFGGASGAVIAATTVVAAGAILAMLADTMIPEAFAEAHDFAGMITVLGFLAAFMLDKLAE